jgi:prevent-host-death family protein
LAYIAGMDNVISPVTEDTLSVEAASARFDEVVDCAVHDKACLVLTRDGKPVAAIVPIEDYEALEAIEDAYDAKLAREAIAAWEEAGRPPGIPMEKIARELI